VLTLLGGRPVHGSGDFEKLTPALPPAMPDWSPVRRFGGYQARHERRAELVDPRQAAAGCGCASGCNVHGHAHAAAWMAGTPASDAKGFWGAFGCSCWAI
jgi:hypothetical protein